MTTFTILFLICSLALLIHFAGYLYSSQLESFSYILRKANEMFTKEQPI